MLVTTDYFTKWVEVEPMSHIRDVNVKKFLWQNIITRFGIPQVFVADNDKQFDSKLIRGFCLELGIKNYFSTPSYPQSNGQAEASNKVMLDGMKKRLERAKSLWVEELPNVLWAYRTTPRRSTGETPFALAYGMEAVIPLEVGLPTIRTEAFDSGTNESSITKQLDWLDCRRDRAAIRLAQYQQTLAKGYNRREIGRAHV